MKITRKQVSLTIGAIGMCFSISGNFILDLYLRNCFFTTGTVIMLVSAMMEKELFFTTLQLIVLSGILMAFTEASETLKAVVPMSVTALFLLLFAYRGELKDKLTLFGSLGIIILSLGYAEANPIIYFTGGLVLAIYATISFYRGVTIALLWAILNYVFMGAAAFNIYRTYFL